MATAAGLPSRERGTARTPAARSTVEKGARRGHRPGPARTPRGARRRSSAGVGDRRGRGGRRLRRPRRARDGAAGKHRTPRVAGGAPHVAPGVDRAVGRAPRPPTGKTFAGASRSAEAKFPATLVAGVAVRARAPRGAMGDDQRRQATLAGQAAAFAAGERSAKNAAFAGDRSAGRAPRGARRRSTGGKGATVACPIAAPALPGKVRAGADEGLT